MEEPVENGGGEYIVTEDLAPLRDELVGSEEEAALLVAASDKMEEEMSHDVAADLGVSDAERCAETQQVVDIRLYVR
jgi:hypothetical protein